jgi:hypothetical protein
MFRKRTRILKRLVLGFAVAASSRARRSRLSTGWRWPAELVQRARQGRRRCHAERDAERLRGRRDLDRERAAEPTGSSITGEIESVRLSPSVVESVRVTPHGTTAEIAATSSHWRDVGVLGASILLGFVLLAAAAFYSTRPTGEPQTA